jgi:probable F420-dependent oxidoreductase
MNRVGVVFPQTEIGPDPGAIRAYAEAVEAAGYDHVLAYDHVLGADPAAHPEISGRAYTHRDQFHEPLVLFGYLAGICSLGLMTGILILPQRQTALVAKQAAEVDLLSAGRLRLGVGIGWNPVEYEALSQSFRTRGRRIEEQVALLRRLWTEPVVDRFAGEHHRVTAAGIAPLPVQRPIPVWLGAASDERALRRAGRIGDGWIPLARPGPELDRAVALVRQGAEEAGRDPSLVGMEGRVDIGRGDPDGTASDAAAWRKAGASHLALNTMRAGFTSVDQHISALQSAAPGIEEVWG